MGTYRTFVTAGIYFFLPLLLTAEPLSLAEALAVCKSQNPRLLIARQQVIQARAAAKKEWGDLMPQIDFSAEKIYNDLKGTRQLTSSVPLTGTSNALTLAPINANRTQIRLRQLLFDFKLPDRIRLGQLQLAVQEQKYAELEAEQLFQTIQIYYAIAKTEQVIQALDHHIGVLRHHLAESSEKLALQRTTKETLLELRKALNDKQFEWLQKQQELVNLRYKFGLVLGGQSAIDVHPDPPVSATDPMPAVEAFAIEEEVYVNRPEIQILEAELAIADIQLDMVRKRILPTFSGETTYGYANSGGFTLSDDDRDFMWTLSGSIPLFDGLKSSHDLEAFAAKKLEMSEQLRFKKLEVQTEIVMALNEWDYAKQKVRTAAIDTEFAAEHLAGEEAKAALKRATGSAVWDAKQRLIDAQTNAALQQWDLMIAKAKFFRAMGYDMTRL